MMLFRYIGLFVITIGCNGMTYDDFMRRDNAFLRDYLMLLDKKAPIPAVIIEDHKSFLKRAILDMGSRFFGDWQVRFDSFEQKMQLLEPKIKELDDHMSSFYRNEFFLYTILGLKPMSDADRPEGIPDWVLRIIEHQSNDFIVMSTEDMKNYDGSAALINRNHMFPLDFVVRCYSCFYESPIYLRGFAALIRGFDNPVSIMEKVRNYSSLSQQGRDELLKTLVRSKFIFPESTALIYGYQPCALKVLYKKTFPVFYQEFHKSLSLKNLRLLVLPGAVYLPKELNPYEQLYSVLLEYFLISRFGPKLFFDRLIHPSLRQINLKKIKDLLFT
jgi:hypothetical protein